MGSPDAISLPGHEARVQVIPPLVCPIRVNGIDVVIDVYPTTDRARLPEAARDEAVRTAHGRGLFVARHDPEA